MLAAVFGATSGVAGSVISGMGRNLPTGPTITIFLTTIVLASLLFARNRELLWQSLHRRRQRKQIQTDTALMTLYRLEQSHPEETHAHSIDALQASLPGDIPGTMDQLASQGWVTEPQPLTWHLTKAGAGEAMKRLDELESSIDERL